MNIFFRASCKTSILKNVLLFACIFVIMRCLIILLLFYSRDLPIEVDDAFVYAALGNFEYNDPERVGQTARFLEEIFDLTSIHMGSSPSLVRYNAWISSSPYPLFSKILGYLNGNLGFSLTSIWWAKALFAQFIIGLMVMMLGKVYFLYRPMLLTLFLFLSFFHFTVVNHQLTATPNIIGTSLFVIGWALLRLDNINILVKLIIGFNLLILGLKLHPGVAIVAVSLLISDFVLALSFKSRSHLLQSLTTIIALLIVYLLEFTTYLQSQINSSTDIVDPLNIASQNTISYVALGNVFDAVQYNLLMTGHRLHRLIDSQYLLPYGASVFLYGISLFVLWKNQTEVVLINLIFLTVNVVGLIHIIDSHPGELINYYGPIQLVFLTVLFVMFLERCILSVKKYISIKFVPVLITLFSMLVLVEQSSASHHTIRERITRHNFANNIPLIKSCLQIAENNTLLVGDEYTLAMVLSLTTTNKIALVDNLNSNEKVWILPDSMYPIEFFLGNLAELQNISVGNKRYEVKRRLLGEELVCASIEAGKINAR